LTETSKDETALSDIPKSDPPKPTPKRFSKEPKLDDKLVNDLMQITSMSGIFPKRKVRT
jgi:hypothetical protein